MLAPVTHILPLTVIERTRVLPIQGEILVRAGQKVRANDIVASAVLEPKHLMINIAQALGVPEGKAAQYIERDVGEAVEAGDVIASRSGLGKRVVRAPVAGKIAFIAGGHVLLQVKTEPFQLKAGLPGTISNLVTEQGVVIEATGAVVQGVWGNGHIEVGLMNVLAEKAEKLLTPDQIDVSMRGSVVMGGICENPETLRNGAEQRLRGMILGSMPASMKPLALKMPYPILILDGFGKIPVNDAAFKLLSTNDKREVAINAEPADPYQGHRPEVVIPLPGSEQLDYPVNRDTLEIGQKVLITRAPNLRKVGTIETISPGPMNFPSGIRARAIGVRLSKEKLVKVPANNIEILA